MSALDIQVAGSHYKGKRIQPVEYIAANNLTFLEGCIVKRITRWRDKPASKRFEDLKAQEQTYKLNGYQNDFPIILGENMDLEDYFPVQYSLPKVYGIGEREVLPKNPNDSRTIQAFQLKGYLQFFEQILSNHHAQLNHLNDLFSFDESTNQTYFVHLLSEINNLRDLILDNLPDNKADELVFNEFSALILEIIEPEKLFHKRRNVFLNHLMARFNENMSEYEQLTRFILNNAADKKLISVPSVSTSKLVVLSIKPSNFICRYIYK